MLGCHSTTVGPVLSQSSHHGLARLLLFCFFNNLFHCRGDIQASLCQRGRTNSNHLRHKIWEEPTKQGTQLNYSKQLDLLRKSELSRIGCRDGRLYTFAKSINKMRQPLTGAGRVRPVCPVHPRNVLIRSLLPTPEPRAAVSGSQ